MRPLIVGEWILVLAFLVLGVYAVVYAINKLNKK